MQIVSIEIGCIVLRVCELVGVAVCVCVFVRFVFCLHSKNYKKYARASFRLSVCVCLAFISDFVQKKEKQQQAFSANFRFFGCPLI